MRRPRCAYTGTTTAFNGAATCSLRNVQNDIAGYAKAVSLQWGRNMFVAECDIYGRHAVMGATLLQWGRNMFVAECANQVAVPGYYFSLQWGRNMFVAECYAIRPDADWQGILQWGRNMFVAECNIDTCIITYISLPSMGPQHVRCGMVSC